ncbi:MAG: M20/M25/M40 family metallo-hydrolase [Anaerolineales bacterium]
MKTHRALIIISMLILATLACSLSADAPPTLAPNTPVQQNQQAATITPDAAVAPPTLQPINVRPPSGVSQAQPSSPISLSNVNQVSLERIMADLNTLVGFRTRHILSSTASNTGIQAAETFLLNELRAIAATSPNEFLSIDVYAQRFSMEWAGQEIFPANVVMAIQGTDASAGVVMIVAHYDSTSENWYDGDSLAPGANDNGTGVAALLEIARLMVQQPHRATLVFVFFAAEETGRQGSEAFVSQYIQAQNIPLVAVINVDSIGSTRGPRGEVVNDALRVFSDGPNIGSAGRALARMIEVAVGRQVPEIDIELIDRIDRPGRWGDQMSFAERGYPAVRMMEAAEDPSRINSSRDTVDLIDQNYFHNATKVVLAALEMLADGPNPPTLRAIRPSTTDPNSLTLEWSHSPACLSYVIALRQPEALSYSEFYTVEATSLSWGGFRSFEAVSVACVDSEGRLGRFAPEVLITTPAS